MAMVSTAFKGSPGYSTRSIPKGQIPPRRLLRSKPGGVTAQLLGVCDVLLALSQPY